MKSINVRKCNWRKLKGDTRQKLMMLNGFSVELKHGVGLQGGV